MTLSKCWLFKYWGVGKCLGGISYYKNIDTLKAKNIELENRKTADVYTKL